MAPDCACGRVSDSDGNEVFKLTQKIPEQNGGARRGLITTFYLSKQEFDVFANLPATEF